MGTTTEFLVDKYYCGLTLPRIIVWNFAFCFPSVPFMSILVIQCIWSNLCNREGNVTLFS